MNGTKLKGLSLVAFFLISLVGCGNSSSKNGTFTIAPITNPPQTTTVPGEGRALWLTRWHATSETQLKEAIQYMKDHHLNILMVQVYGDGMALYNSSVAPRSGLVSGSFDNLQKAIELGHAAGIEVHAWLNVVKVYTTTLARPGNPNHLINAHPEWSMVDQNGVALVDKLGTSPAASIFFCPEHPGFFKYLTDLTVEVAGNYNVDGINLDYIRYPSYNYCFCKLHKDNFQAKYGYFPTRFDSKFDQWRYDNITKLVESIYTNTAAVNPLIKISANFTKHSYTYQDAHTWLKKGIIDIACPMLYTSDMTLFKDRVRDLVENSGGRLIMPGVDVTSTALEDQIIDGKKVDGVTLFSYKGLDSTGTAILDRQYTTAVPTPLMPWKDGTLDMKGPVLSGISTTNLSASEGVILWRSNEETTGWIEYGTTQSLGQISSTTALGYDHYKYLSTLTAQTQYYYQVVAKDAAGNITKSPINTFQTTNAPAGSLIMDNTDGRFSTMGTWSSGTSSGGYQNDYLYSSSTSAIATYSPFIPQAGTYNIYVWYVHGANRTTYAEYTLKTPQGNQVVAINQTTGGKQWVLLGTFSLDAGMANTLEVTGGTTSGVAIADAIKIEKPVVTP